LVSLKENQREESKTADYEGASSTAGHSVRKKLATAVRLRRSIRGNGLKLAGRRALDCAINACREQRAITIGGIKKYNINL
jgi:hypothetical protein